MTLPDSLQEIEAKAYPVSFQMELVVDLDDALEALRVLGGTEQPRFDDAMALLREMWLAYPGLPKDLQLRIETVLGHHPLAGYREPDPDPLYVPEFDTGSSPDLSRRPYPGWSTPPGPLSRLVAWVRRLLP